jgi:pimeloyl-ACP methyl ester carboxylesterase
MQHLPADDAAPFPEGVFRPAGALPIVLVPGLLSSPRLFSLQLPALWQFGPTMIADNTRADTIAAIAADVLAAAPPRFSLAGLSMGGYIAFEIMRQAAGRVAKLALLDTSARPDTPEQTQRRHAQIATAQAGGFAEIPDQQYPLLFHPDHLGNQQLRQITRLMASETGAEGFARQQQAIMSRPDSRPDLHAITCPTLVLVGDNDRLTPPEYSAEIANAIGNARLVIIPECGHLSTLDQPDETTRALQQWLAG